METFIPLKPLVDNREFPAQRARAIAELESAAIDAPIVGLVSGLNSLPYCFTIQSCCGHFLYGEHLDPRNTERLPPSENSDTVEYRIAYVALCVDNCGRGESFLRDLQAVTCIDPDYVQFGCATWFWGRQVNSYALQVEPDRFKTKDSVCVDYQEALHLQSVRDACYARLGHVLDLRRGMPGPQR